MNAGPNRWYDDQNSVYTYQPKMCAAGEEERERREAEAQAREAERERERNGNGISGVAAVPIVLGMIAAGGISWALNNGRTNTAARQRTARDQREDRLIRELNSEIDAGDEYYGQESYSMAILKYETALITLRSLERYDEEFANGQTAFVNNLLGTAHHAEALRYAGTTGFYAKISADRHYQSAITCYTTALDHSIPSDKRSLVYLNRARSYYRMGKITEAETDLQQSLRCYRNDDALALLSQIENQKRQAAAEEAAAAHARAIAEEKRRQEEAKRLAEEEAAKKARVALLWAEANADALRSHHTGVIEKCSDLIPLCVPSADILLLRGEAYHHLSNFTEAINDFTSALRINSDNLKAYNLRALSYESLGDTVSAIADYESTLRYELNHQTHEKLGKLYAEIENYAEAIAHFTVILTSADPSTYIYFERAQAYQKNNNYSEAIEDYRNYTRHHEDEKGYWELGLALYNYAHSQKGEQKNTLYAEAALAFEEVIEYDPLHADAWYYLAHSKHLQLDFTGIEDAYSNAIEYGCSEMANAYFNRGQTRFVSNPDGAIADYAEAINRKTSFMMDAHYQKARLHYQKQDYTAAIFHLEETVKMDPNHKEAHYLLGQAYEESISPRLRSLLYLSSNKAIKAYSAVIRLESSHTGALSKRAALYSNQNKYREAADDYRKLAELGHSPMESHYQAGLNYAKLATNEGYSLAITQFREVKRLKPDHESVLLHLGKALLATDNLNDAVLELTEFVKKNPEHTEARYLLAKAYYDKADKSKTNSNTDLAAAASSFAEIIKRNPRHADAWYYLAHSKHLQLDFTGIEDAYSKAIEYGCSEMANAYFNRGQTRFVSNPDGAIADYAEAIKRDSKWKALAHLEKGKLHHHKKEYDAALKDFEQSLPISTQPADVHVAIGQVHEAMGKNDLAYQAYSKALTISASHSDAKKNLYSISTVIKDSARPSMESKTSSELAILRALQAAWLERKSHNSHRGDLAGYIGIFAHQQNTAKQAFSIHPDGKTYMDAACMGYLAAINEAQQAIYEHLLHKKSFRRTEGSLTRLNDTITRHTAAANSQAKPWLQASLPPFTLSMMMSRPTWIAHVEEAAVKSLR